MAHACNPSYSGGSDQEDLGLKPAQANSSVRPCLENTHPKKGLGEWLKVKALSSSPSTTKNKNKTNKQKNQTCVRQKTKQNRSYWRQRQHGII
jgi:hypothetical protein